jgi:site-specific DNA recombinase
VRGGRARRIGNW